MEWLDFKSHPLALNFAVFAAAGLVVWISGIRLSRYASTIAHRTGIGQAVIGMVLLGGITSLPEIAVAVTSALANVAPLAVNNLLGGVAMQITFLAVADALLGREALTHVVAKPGVLLQGALAILMLGLVAAAVMVGDRPLFNIGAWCWGILGTYCIAVWMVSKERNAWVPSGASGGSALDMGQGIGNTGHGTERFSGRTVLMRTIIAAAFILAAGFVLSRTGEAIAEKTALGASFVGAVLLALCTSLPEISTVYSLVRMRRYVMAVSEMFGTGMFNVALLFVVDAVYRGGPVLNEVGRFSGFAALLGIALITMFMVGLIERRDKTVLRMGIDSLAALLIYFGGLVVLYRLR